MTPRAARGEYAGIDLHAGLVCIYGLPEGSTKAEQLETFSVALDLIEQHGSDATNLLVEVVWAADGIDYEVAKFPAEADENKKRTSPDSTANQLGA